MAESDTEVVIVGGGAAGIAAGHRLRESGIHSHILEARSRLGGRAWTDNEATDSPLDLGCGWLHSADRNPWVAIAEQQGRTIDRSPPPWEKPVLPAGFRPSDQAAYRAALQAFYRRLEEASADEKDSAAARLLDADGRWNGLINAVSTYTSGAELSRISLQDLSRYHDSGVNWRVVEGYGTVIAGHAAGLRVSLDTPVRRIDHSGRRLRVETANGTISADQAIVTLSSNLIAGEELIFTPALPDKTAAAAGLPLGLADKLFLSFTSVEPFPEDSRLFGRTDRTGTASYHFRPFGRSLIEAYFAGSLAADLERGGLAAFHDFAAGELADLFGSSFVHGIRPLRLHCWGSDPYARGSYSYAMPGQADCREALARPVDGRLFFAGEACSRNDFSTAHGAYLTGHDAADQARAARSTGIATRAPR